MSVLKLLRPGMVLGVGCYARDRATAVLRAPTMEGSPVPVVACLTHPSPASPKANRGWRDLALAELRAWGVLDCLVERPPWTREISMKAPFFFYTANPVKFSVLDVTSHSIHSPECFSRGIRTAFSLGWFLSFVHMRTRATYRCNKFYFKFIYKGICPAVPIIAEWKWEAFWDCGMFL